MKDTQSFVTLICLCTTKKEESRSVWVPASNKEGDVGGELVEPWRKVLSAESGDALMVLGVRV